MVPAARSRTSAQIEASLHAHGHLALDDLQQGIGGLTDGVIIGSKNAGGMDHAGLQAHDVDCVQHHLGCGGFALGVSTHHLLGITGSKLRNLGNGCSVGLLGDGAGGTDIDHLLAFGVI